MIGEEVCSKTNEDHKTTDKRKKEVKRGPGFFVPIKVVPFCKGVRGDCVLGSKI